MYQSSLRSYRELPFRFAEWGDGVSLRAGRGVTRPAAGARLYQDDAHHFCRPDQMPEEIDFVLNFCLHILRSFGFAEFNAYLSTRPGGDKAVGDPALWRDAEAALEAALKRAAIPYEIDAGRRLLRAQDRPENQGRHPAASGSSPPSSSTLTCPSASI